ncbi:zinc transporter ZTP29 [Senna tora]|uniref:Zinc transporter ZTP29 n=1 Tax=Senna tora TaxID=362788 RepID=A0A834TLT4_9FABA|nr:zinc transporter ZTP29 [Senna tora]
MDSQVTVALALSILGGLSTSIGALFVIVNQSPSLKMLGLLQGFAAGLMLSISFFDLAHNALNSLGFLKGNLWVVYALPHLSIHLTLVLFFYIMFPHASSDKNFISFCSCSFFAGVIFFAIVASFIPEPTLVPTSDVKSKKRDGDEGGKDIMKKRRRQVFFSGIITAIDCETDPHCFSAIKNANTCSFGNRILVKGF